MLDLSHSRDCSTRATGRRGDRFRYCPKYDSHWSSCWRMDDPKTAEAPNPERDSEMDYSDSFVRRPFPRPPMPSLDVLYPVRLVALEIVVRACMPRGRGVDETMSEPLMPQFGRHEKTLVYRDPSSAVLPRSNENWRDTASSSRREEREPDHPKTWRGDRSKRTCRSYTASSPSMSRKLGTDSVENGGNCSVDAIRRDWRTDRGEDWTSVFVWSVSFGCIVRVCRGGTIRGGRLRRRVLW